MIRQNLTPGSPYADVMVHGDGLVSLQYRDAQDGPTRQIKSAVSHPRRVQLEREGDFVYFSVAGADGVLHHAGGSFRIAFREPYYVGLALSAHNNAVAETAIFSNVELAVPKLAYVPDTGYAAQVEATLEVMEVGGVQSRRVVRQFDGKIEAPNWTRDGKSLIYNADGRIWRIPVDGRRAGGDRHRAASPATTTITACRPTGKLLVDLRPVRARQSLAHPCRCRSTARHAARRSSTIRRRAPTGTAGRPTAAPSPTSASAQPTAATTSRRADLAGGRGAAADRRLRASTTGRNIRPTGNTSTSTRPGRARCRSGARTPTAATPSRSRTTPTCRDWFPHFSPDGKWIAFISFGDDVALDDHPPNRSDVMLRIMPADGSAPPVGADAPVRRPGHDQRAELVAGSTAASPSSAIGWCGNHAQILVRTGAAQLRRRRNRSLRRCEDPRSNAADGLEQLGFLRADDRRSRLPRQRQSAWRRCKQYGWTIRRRRHGLVHGQPGRQGPRRAQIPDRRARAC